MHCPCPYPSISPAVNSGRTLQPRGQGQAGQCQQLLRPEDEPAHGQHAVLACQTRPRGDTRNFLQIWGLLSADASCFISNLVLLSHRDCGATAIAGTGHVHGVHRGPTAVAVPCPSLQPLGGRLEKLSLTPQCCQPQGQHPEWEQGCIRHRGCEYRPANTEKKEVWTPSYICVFAVCT